MLRSLFYGASQQSNKVFSAQLPCKGLRFMSTAPASSLYTIDASKTYIENTKSPKKKFSDKKSLVFGKEFTDHMLEIEWDQNSGWGAPKISAYHDISISPAASSLHYALQCFEGMKAYKDDQGKIRLFRPLENAKRFNTSASRICLPTFNHEGFLEALKKLVLLDKDWIPEGKGYSLYIRPTLISTQKSVGVTAPTTALMFIILSPVGPYYPTGFKPVKLLADDFNVRAAPGGTGSYKIGSNYASTILPQRDAAAKGFSQILWLNGDKVAEVGTMNMFMLWKNKSGVTELVTPPLSDGTILPGVTRDSIIQLARSWGDYVVSERVITMPEVIAAVQEKRMLEAFGAGTAAIVSPIESITYKGTEYKIPIDASLGSGPFAKRCMDTILSIQYGETDHPWSVVIGDK